MTKKQLKKTAVFSTKITGIPNFSCFYVFSLPDVANVLWYQLVGMRKQSKASHLSEGIAVIRGNVPHKMA